MRALVTTASLLVAFAAATPALAKDAPPETDSHTRTAARALAAEGTEAFERREYERALDRFDRALSLVRAPTLALMRARTLVELGRWVEAVDTYATLPRADDPNNPAFRQAMAEAEHELAALMPRLPRLRVSVRGPDGARPEVRIDGRKLEEALVGVDSPVDPGPHRVEVLLSGRAPEVRDVTVAERDRKELVIELVAPEPAPRPDPVAPPVPPPAPRESSGIGVPAIASFATAGAGFLLGVATGAIALGKKSDLDAVCTVDCPESMRGTLSAFRLHRTLSYVGFGVGVVGAGVGSYFLMSEPEVEGSAQLSLGVSPSGVLVSGRF
jgi:hypothetical protein